ncbi:SCAN box domain-containing protein [Trichonephila clavipes]|nr:SCAN box domain-containing protein [Trichonephila clavipes]
MEVGDSFGTGLPAPSERPPLLNFAQNERNSLRYWPACSVPIGREITPRYLVLLDQGTCVLCKYSFGGSFLMWCEKKTASVFATFKAILQVENQSSSLAICLCKNSRDIIYIYIKQYWRDGTALGRSSVNFPVGRMDIVNFDREGSVKIPQVVVLYSLALDCDHVPHIYGDAYSRFRASYGQEHDHELYFNVKEVKIILDRVISDRKEQERSKQEEKEREEKSKQEEKEWEERKVRKLELSQRNQPLNDESGRRVEIEPTIHLTQIATKFDEKHDEISLYLINFERKVELAQVPKKDWVAYLLAVLPAALSNMLAREPTERANNYDFVKYLIFKRPQCDKLKNGETVSSNETVRNGTDVLAPYTSLRKMNGIEMPILRDTSATLDLIWK